MNDIIIVMGVSGTGKTTVAQGIATSMAWEFAEGDAFHPEPNIAKMASGHPLTDEDRWPWLRAIGAWIDDHNRSGASAVIACSALKRAYRDLLREGRPTVRFVHVTAEPALIEDRMEHRQGHFMPASLLPSQLATLENLQTDEAGLVMSAAGPPDKVLHRVLIALGLALPGDVP